MQLNLLRSGTLILVLVVLLGACANPAGSSGGNADLTVVNNMGVVVTLEAGDFSSAVKGGYSAPYRLTLGSSNTGVGFSLPVSTGLNLWKRDSAGAITSYLGDSSGTNVRSFEFSAGIRYTLTLNNGSYSLAVGSAAPVTTTAATVTNRVFPTTTRSAFTPEVTASVNAKDLTVANGTVVSRRTSVGWQYTFLAEVSSPAAVSAKTVSFVKARVDLLDETGALVYSTSQMPKTYSAGFNYLEVPAQGRFLSSGTYDYGNNDLFPGGKAYLVWNLYLYDTTDSANPLFGLDIGRVKGMRLALISEMFTILGITPVPASLALATGPAAVVGNQWQGSFSTPATSSVWWQIGSSSKVLFQDAAGRLLDNAYVDLGSGSSWLIGPGKSSNFTAKVPVELQGTAVSAVALMSPEVGIPLTASVSSRSILTNLPAEPDVFAARNQAQAETAARLASQH